MMELIWRWETIRSSFASSTPLITKEIAHNAGSTYHFDASKIRHALDFEFTPIERSIERTGKKFLDQVGVKKIKG